MGGKTKASSWIGCLCTLGVLAVIVLFFLAYIGSFRNKDASKHTFSEITTDEFPTVDLGELKFKMLRSYFDADGTFFQMLQVKQELVKYGSKRQEISRTPLELGSC